MTVRVQLESGALTDLLFDDPLIGRCLVAPDDTILRVNPEWLRATGFAADAVLGVSVVDLFPESRDLAIALHARAREGHTVSVPRHAQRLQDRDTWWEGSIAPVPMEGGMGLLITAREVHAAVVDAELARLAEQRQLALDAARVAEASLRERTALLRAISDTSEDVIFAKDRDGRMRFANPATLALVGRTLEEVLGRTDAEFLRDAAAAQHVMENDRRIMETGTAEDVEEVVPRPDGTARTWFSRKTPYRDEAGHVIGLLGISRDITERKQAEETLRDSDRRKSEFLAVLSHELRNPLAPIRNSIYVLEQAPPGSEQARRARDVVRRQVDHLTRLVDDLLDLTRISRGRVALRRARVDLRDIARRTADDLHSVFARAGVALRVAAAGGDPVWVDADPTRMAQVLGNLLQNSVKFTGRGGEVEVSVAARDGRAELRVRDDGIGMEPATVEHMFEPFAQADRTLARTSGGLGLGLALVKALVEMHGGAVRAASAGLGRGSELVVEVPLADGAGVQEVAAAARRDGAGRVVLVVEDNPDGAQTLADVLELNGYRVRLARDGREGIAVAQELRPDVVLCDIGLPDMNGYEVARALRRDPTFRGTRLVALSGYAQPDDRERAREAGFDAHVAKPADLDLLVREIATEIATAAGTPVG